LDLNTSSLHLARFWEGRHVGQVGSRSISRALSRSACWKAWCEVPNCAWLCFNA